MIDVQGEQVSASERFALRELIADWNRRLDRGDIDGLATLSDPDVHVTFDGARFEGLDGLREFVSLRRSTPDVARRTHLNHVQAWRRGERLTSRSLTLIVALVPTPSDRGDGSPQPSWVGYAEDELVWRDGWRFAARSFSRWSGDVLERFPIAWQETA